MRSLLLAIGSLLLAGATLAQNTPSGPVTKNPNTGDLLGDLAVPSGRTLTVRSGGNVNFASGSTLTPPSTITLGSGSGSGVLNLGNPLGTASVKNLAGSLTFYDASRGDIALSSIALTNAANTFTAAAQIAPSWRLPAYAGSVTIPADAYGMGWDETGRFTLQSPVGALQLYAVGSPSVPTIYWPGNIVAQTMTSSAMTTTIAANYITAGDAGNSGLNGTVLDNSLVAPMREWQGTFTRAGANGIPTGTDAQGTGSSLEFLDGTYWPQASVTGASTTTSTIVGRYRTSAQARADLAAPEVVAAPATASSTGTAGQIAYDASYFYVCTATDTWKRTALSTW